MISRSERVATSLTYIGAIDLCVLCVPVVPSTRSRVASALRPPAGLYLRIHFAHQT
ncbi:hypothetical protein C789_766 [Microcystis aeruginosa FACHB-905 = DIANCHI905]|nr:hypothetical protein C789_766 [Microcystis aeruginosa FACHB-905 = DIANCHI905]